MQITLNLDQESFEILHELVEKKYYESMSILERNLKIDKYKILSDKNDKTVNRFEFEKEVCEYARWIPIMNELSRYM